MTRLPSLALALAVAAAGMATAQQVSFAVSGEDRALKKALEGASVVLPLEDEEAKSAQDVLAAARAEYKRLLTALYSQGYYGGRISVRVDGREAAQIAPLEAPARVGAVTVSVEPGQQFRFGETRLGPVPPGAELPESFGPGEIARANAVRDAAKAAVEAWRQQGHAKANAAQQKITANHSQERLDVAIGLDPGPRLTFGNLVLDGKSAVRPERIREIAGLPVGDVYDPDRLNLAQDRLRRTGAFQSVALIDAENYGPDLSLPIEAKIADMKPRRIGAGLEYSNVQGITASAYWLHRNFLGGAERFRIGGEIAGIGQNETDPDYSLDLEFARPATFGPENTLNAALSYQQRDEPEFFLRALEAQVGITRIVNETFTISAGLGVLNSQFRDAYGSRNYTLLEFPIEASLERRDDPLNPSHGYFLAAEVKPFYGFEEAGRGARLYFDGRVYRSFGADKRITLAARGQIGAVVGAEARDVPADFLFFSGGGGTVRGQGYQSLGVATGGGDLVGGRSFVGAQLEARVKVRPKLSLVGFYDWGHVSANELPGSDGASHAGAGVGVRYDTMIGPIRLDLATPASGDKVGEELQIYIGIGQAF